MPGKTTLFVRMNSFLPVVLLFLVGSMIAFSVNLSKLVADAGAPILWLVAISLLGAGLAVLILATALGQVQGKPEILIPYSLGAGVFLAAPTALSFLSVVHVGAGFMSVVFAFPLLFTYLLAVILKMERLKTGKVLGVICGLMGGVLLSVSKFQTLEAGGWLAVAALIPLIIAVGNIYRTRFWPHGASAVLLSSMTLIAGGLLIGILAAVQEGGDIQLLWQNGYLQLLLLANLAVFAIQFALYFVLQRMAGPTYLSQIGSVGAALGVTIAVLVFGDPLPGYFALSMGLIVAGVILFQRANAQFA